jgi:hypothetical protein
MKKIFILTVILISGLFTNAQKVEVVGTERIPVDPNTKLITFQAVVEEEGTKKELFNRASEWLHHYFKQPVYVTQVRDAASGVIKGKHQFELYRYEKDSVRLIAGMIKYSFKIECKENRYRYTLDNFLLTQASRYPCEKWLDTKDRDYNEQWNIYLEQIRSYALDDFAASLIEYMVPEVQVEEEEW